MTVWVITILVCAHGHGLCQRHIDDAYFLKRSDCEFVLSYLPSADRPRCARRPRHQMIAEGFAPVGRVPKG